MDENTLVRDSRQPGHFWADNEIVDQHLPTIGVYGFAVYMLLCKYADSKTGQCDPSVGTMAKKLSISDPTVRTALDKLKKAGLIGIRHRRKEREGKLINQTSIYTILAVKKAQTTTPTKGDLVPNEIDHPTKPGLPGVLNQVYQGTKGDLVGVLNQVSSNNTHLNNTQLTTPTPATPKNGARNGSDGDGDEIENVFWEYNINAAAEIAQQYHEQCPSVDAATIRQSIENLIASGLTIGTIVNRLRKQPPAPGKPYARATNRKSGERVAQTVNIAKPPSPPPDAVPAHEAARRMLSMRNPQKGSFDD